MPGSPAPTTTPAPAPADVTDRVADAVRESAVEAGRLLFGDTPVEFALDVSVVDSYADAV